MQIKEYIIENYGVVVERGDGELLPRSDLLVMAIRTTPGNKSRRQARS